MGLSSSQARLLHLTSRMHQIEYKAAKLEAEKLQLANDSSRVYENYLLALDKTKIQMRKLNENGTVTFTDVTYQMMLDKGYQIKFQGDESIVVTEETKNNYEKAVNADHFVALQTGRIDANGMNGDYYEIYSAEQLATMPAGKNCRLMTDIDMSGTSWTSKSIGSITFDGNGHSITGLDNALFSSIGGGTVKNLTLQGNTTTSRGILANNINSGSTISDISVSGSINSTENNIGGLAGQVTGSNITIQNCRANVNITTTGSTVGGLFGQLNGTTADNSITIDNCSSSGSLKGDNCLGGAFGWTAKATITNCSTSSNVYSTKYDTTSDPGPSGSNGYAGGFVGSMFSNTTISNSEAHGDVKTAGSGAGGFIGTTQSNGNHTITNCNAYGDVLSNCDKKDNAGDIKASGAFISMNNSGTITNCNAYGEATSYKYESGSWTEVPTAGFAYSNGASDNSTAGTITNGYSAASGEFVEYNHNGDFTEAPPNFNSITVTPPTIKTTETLADPNNDKGLYAAMKEYGYVLTADSPAAGHENDVTWFTNMVLEGMLYIYKADNTREDGLFQVSVSTDQNLIEVSDEINLKKAEAQYEADMNKINKKDRRYDTELAKLETERGAIKEEMDTLKTVAKENVDRTFKLFS